MSIPSPSAPGTGQAGRRLLAALDRATNTDTDVVHVVRSNPGLWQIEGRGARYATATLRTLIDAGLVEELTVEEPGIAPERRALRLSPGGARLLGA